MASLRENLMNARTRWLTIATLLSGVVALVGAVLLISTITAFAAETTVPHIVLVSAEGIAIAGVVLSTLFATLLARKSRHR